VHGGAEHGHTHHAHQRGGERGPGHACQAVSAAAHRRGLIFGVQKVKLEVTEAFTVRIFSAAICIVHIVLRRNKHCYTYSEILEKQSHKRYNLCKNNK